EVQRARATRPAEVEHLRTQVAEVRHAAAAVTTLTAQAQDARGRLDAHEQVALLRARRDAARERWLGAREQALALKDALLTIQMARVEGMAAELAGSLAVGGGCCPVCGSAEHPSLAHSAPGAPDGAAEKSARKSLGDAEVVEHALDQQVRELEQSLAAATARAGDLPAEALVERLAEHQTALADALRAAGRLPDLESRLTADEAELDRLGERLATLLSESADADADHRSAATEAAALRADLEAVGASDLGDLDAMAATHRRTTELCADALRARDDAAEAAWSGEQALRALDEAAVEAGFADADQAVAAVLDDRRLERLAEATAHHQQRLAAVAEVLREAGPDDDGPAPDLDAVTSAHETAVATARRAAADEALHAGRSARLTGLLAELDDALAAWLPLRRDLDLVTRLAAFVEGRSTDNLLRMRLSAFVLAYRLSQVVDAANERLARMSDQRYSLEHTGKRGAGETRGGLSLLVRDDWSGESRDPATLSGGETFVVSLALALGLADVIAHEAGGASLDTLFVDEGFGSLDADTLDDVMDTLDALRDGGRVVGVVSHVAEMRDRIPTQLVVTKSRAGSTVSLRR
ncbi:MAG: putative exonuclease, partial [Nocardioides sp.]|nr:putative exonuclease [Nocardioides sp.]